MTETKEWRVNDEGYPVLLGDTEIKDEDYPHLTDEEYEACKQRSQKPYGCFSCKNWCVLTPNMGQYRRESPMENGINTANFPLTHFQTWCDDYVQV